MHGNIFFSELIATYFLSNFFVMFLATQLQIPAGPLRNNGHKPNVSKILHGEVYEVQSDRTALEHEFFV